MKERFDDERILNFTIKELYDYKNYYCKVSQFYRLKKLMYKTFDKLIENVNMWTPEEHVIFRKIIHLCAKKLIKRDRCVFFVKYKNFINVKTLVEQPWSNIGIHFFDLFKDDDVYMKYALESNDPSVNYEYFRGRKKLKLRINENTILPAFKLYFDVNPKYFLNSKSLEKRIFNGEQLEFIIDKIPDKHLTKFKVTDDGLDIYIKKLLKVKVEQLTNTIIRALYYVNLDRYPDLDKKIVNEHFAKCFYNHSLLTLELNHFFIYVTNVFKYHINYPIDLKKLDFNYRNFLEDESLGPISKVNLYKFYFEEGIFGDKWTEKCMSFFYDYYLETHDKDTLMWFLNTGNFFNMRGRNEYVRRYFLGLDIETTRRLPSNDYPPSNSVYYRDMIYCPFRTNRVTDFVKDILKPLTIKDIKAHILYPRLNIKPLLHNKKIKIAYNVFTKSNNKRLSELETQYLKLNG